MKKFDELPNAIQEIALKKMSTAKTKIELVRSLDSCEELRDLINTHERPYPKEIDLIVRYYIEETNE